MEKYFMNGQEKIDLMEKLGCPAVGSVVGRNEMVLCEEVNRLKILINSAVNRLSMPVKEIRGDGFSTLMGCLRAEKALSGEPIALLFNCRFRDELNCKGNGNCNFKCGFYGRK